MKDEALNDLLYRMADDLLVLGHRNAEWTGIGPLLEEDIAFSSMAQDKIGQSLALYTLLHEAGEPDPDTLGFMRDASDFRNCIFVELPNGEYDFSLIRHFLFDTALAVRIDSLTRCSYEPLANLARKIQAELKYHALHANTFVRKLGTATGESINRLQRSIDEALPFALGIFESTPWEKEIVERSLCESETILESRWRARIDRIVATTALTLPSRDVLTPVYGGRAGQHSEHLQPLIDEMTEVYRSDPETEW